MKRASGSHFLPMCLKIRSGALFVADAHESAKRKEFFQLLQDIDSGKIQTSQLFLMGDIFDLLVGEVENCVKKYHSYIQLLEKIAQNIEVYYFEGNHDFCLENIFLHVKIFPLSKQPCLCEFEDGQKAYLLHGDKYGGLTHRLYTGLIRNKSFLKLLNFIDKKIDYALSNKIENSLLEKNICSKIPNFKELICKKIYSYYPKDILFVIEGHYHQDSQFQCEKVSYVNFSSFACNQSYFIVEFFNGAKFAQKKLRGCDV